MTSIVWNEIENTVNEAFYFQGVSEGVVWTEQAWKILNQAGLTNYSTELERKEKLIYILSLIGIYYDFYRIIFEEELDYFYEDWAKQLGIDLGVFNKIKILEFVQSVKSSLEEKPDNESFEIDDWLEQETEFFENNIEELINQGKTVIYPELIKGFGGNKSTFFRSLYNTIKAELFEENNDIFGENDDILNNVTPENLNAFHWIDEGCYPYQ